MNRQESAANSLADRRWMARALQLARRGLYTTTPNPRVGCVIVRYGDAGQQDGGELVAEGWHQWAGEGHAEVNALTAAGDRAKGATAYVSLEPCAHYGRTPPCAVALVEAGISRVVSAMRDPNPRVNGGGFKILEEAGIETLSGLLEEEARQLNAGFFKRMETGRPLLRCKLAMSVDGRTAMFSGESQWITGSAARSDVQQWRARSCAIVTGVDSIIFDDSSLTVRLDELKVADPEAASTHQPLRVVLDSTLRIPETARILGLSGRTVILCGSSVESDKRERLQQQGADIVTLPLQNGRIDLKAAMEWLAGQDCNEVLLETGATLAGAAIQAGLVDELLVYMAPVLLGSSARPLLNLPIDSMSDKVPLVITDIRSVGDDWRITATPRKD